MSDTEDNELSQDLRQMFASGSTKLLGDLLQEPEVKSACLDTLASIGCRPPTNRLVFFCMSKATLGAGSLLGTAAASRLEQLLLRIPYVRKFFLSLIALNKQGHDREKLRALLLNELRQGSPPRAGELDVVTPLEVVTALYQKQKLEGLTEEFGQLFDGLRSAVESMLADIDERENEPVLRWPLQHGPVSNRSITDTLRYNSGQYRFLGREAEEDFLEQFLGDISLDGPLARFSWLLITGPGGEGKSRLAFEFSRHAESQLGWKAGRMGHDELAKFDVKRWRPRGPTCIIIDYPAQVPEAVNAMLIALQEGSADFDWPVRVLLLERDAEGEWFKRLLPESVDQSAIIQHAYAHNGQRLDKGWRLPAMSPVAVVSVMRERFESTGVEAPDPGLLLQAAFEIDRRVVEINGEGVPSPRPLFAMAAAEAFLLSLEQGETDYAAIVAQLDRQDVLKRLIDRDRQQRWRKAAKRDDRILGLHENLYALVTFCLGLSISKLSELPAHTLDCLPDLKLKGVAPLNKELLAVMSGSRSADVPNLEPDILGEFFVLDTLANLDVQAGQALRDGAFAIGGNNTVIFVLRCLRDFSHLIPPSDFLAPDPKAGRNAVLTFSNLCVDLSAILSRVSDWTRVEQMLGRLDALRKAFADDREIALAEAKAAVNISNHAGTEAAKTGDWTRVEQMLGRLDALRKAFADDREIALEEAKAAVNISNHAGTEAAKTGDWTRVEQMQHRSVQLATLFPDDDEIAIVTAESSIVGYALRRAAMQQLTEDASEAAARVAYHYLILTSTKADPGRLSGFAVQVIKDAKAHFPDNEIIVTTHNQCSDGGIDFEQVPDIPEIS